MVYRCEECGHIFEEGEQAVWREDRGEFWGSPCSEEMSGCPICKGAFSEAENCKICGSYENVEDGFCNACQIDVVKRFTIIINKEFSEEEKELLDNLGYGLQ